MDPSHLLHGLWLIILSVFGFFGKRYINDLSRLQNELNDHRLYDVGEFAKLTTKSDEVARRLEGIDAKLDRLLERNK